MLGVVEVRAGGGTRAAGCCRRTQVLLSPGWHQGRMRLEPVPAPGHGLLEALPSWKTRVPSRYPSAGGLALLQGLPWG